MFANLMRWVRIRGLTEGKMQKGRVEGLPNDARDDAQRPQDYGFAGNPVDGQGLKLEIGGHTVIIRMDRIAERPQLAAYEVAVWHKEGHRLTMKANGVVEIACASLVVNASASVALNTPTVAISGALTVDSTVVATGNVTGAGKSLATHTHSGVQAGGSNTGTPN